MPAVHTLVVFSLVAAVFVAVPGPSNLFVVAQGLQSGSRAGWPPRRGAPPAR